MGKFVVRSQRGNSLTTDVGLMPHWLPSQELYAISHLSVLCRRQENSQARVLIAPVGLDSVSSLGSLVSPWGSVKCTSNRRTVAPLCQVYA